MPPKTILVLAVFLLACIPGCTVDTEPDRADETPVQLRWELVDVHPGDLGESGEPLMVLREDGVLLNLPYLPTFSVSQLAVSDGVLEVTVEFAEDERYHDPWSCPVNAVNILIENMDRYEVQNVRVIDTLQREVDLQVSLQEAVRLVGQFIEADFELPTGFQLALADDAESPPLVYYLDYADGQIIDRGGTTAVAGWFRVCAATGDIIDCSVSRVPMAGRTFLDDASFLSWTPSQHMLVRRGRDLLLYDSDGSIHRDLPGSVTEDLTFILLEEDRAHFTLDGRECIAVCLDTGALLESYCPDTPALPGDVTDAEAEDADGRTVSRKRTVSLVLGDMTVEIRCREELPAEASSLEVTVYHDGGDTLEVPTEALGEYTMLRCWHPYEPHEVIYFSTEIFGPRYGMWVTEYALWQMLPGEGSLRRLSFMPSPDFDICPRGEFGVYQHGGRIFIVDLVQDK